MQLPDCGTIQALFFRSLEPWVVLTSLRTYSASMPSLAATNAISSVMTPCRSAWEEQLAHALTNDADLAVVIYLLICARSIR